MKKKLTELLVTRMRPPARVGGRLEVWDSALPAFGVRITAAGARSNYLLLRRRDPQARREAPGADQGWNAGSHEPRRCAGQGSGIDG